MKATARAHTNIALVKYWGKRDAQLILPQTDSLSLTLDPFYTDTTVEFDPELTQDQLFIDEKAVPADKMGKVERVMDTIRDWKKQSIFARIHSTNHVPISAGLASSASAFAALAAAGAKASGLNLSRRDLSRLARRGSGSATRSIFGGLVEWHRGQDDQSSYAEPIMEKLDFGLEMIAILVDTSAKKVSSRGGMQLSVETSPFYPAWKEVVKHDMTSMKQAIASHDIPAIGHIAQENTLRMHALTLSADPGFTYFDGDTLRAIHLIDDLQAEGINCYYTMDAGPNVKVLYDRHDRKLILQRLGQVFDPARLVVATAGPGVYYL
ncbi:MAG TPA: diphosphomevalonate decarboxylase [Candidatus Limosilactobacillus merdigallinarum]|uniref:diphosphomevalonate decarboxylase n=1 Tax=Candidatus Limosilactobacillus merdigallinarum TaxID=2838652 RepID=A0A9D1VGT4_9LACO|nr:diphosphomevalonate decarboxylase [Candidatus Limosilactobacillus merdigallinarum]